MRKAQAGSNAVLAGSVFDPLDVPFLPTWPELETHPARSITPYADKPTRKEAAPCAENFGTRSAKS